MVGVACIARLDAREILDSRGHPTLEVHCATDAGGEAAAGVPAGASTGAREARELRDGGARYGGLGVRRAIAAVREEIAPRLCGMPVTSQARIDNTLIALDGTAHKSRLGANTLIGVSMATARAAAMSLDLPLYRYLGGTSSRRLPVPALNVFNGGAHAGWEGADFQEYMIVPQAAPNVTEALRWASEIYHCLKALLKDGGLSTHVGDEGGFAPVVASNREPLDWLMHAITAAGFSPGRDVGIAIDAAATGFCHADGYHLSTEERCLNSAALIDYYAQLLNDYPLVMIEDGLGEDDWSGWQRLNARLGDGVTLVGDDIFVTQRPYIARGIRERCANAVLIKLNQVGTVTETLDAANQTHRAGWQTMVSHRSGETADSFMADLAVAAGADYLKSGAPARGERLAKYNRLMAIEAQLGTSACFAGAASDGPAGICRDRL